MTDLYVVRHATPQEPDAVRWPTDRDRPLTEEGIASFQKAARGLRAIGADVAELWTSPLTRARQTADILTEHAGWPRAKESDLLEPGASPELVLKMVGEAGADTLALVGHEPDLSHLIMVLTGGAVEMKKGAVARIALDELKPGGGVLRWLLEPKALGAIG